MTVAPVIADDFCTVYLGDALDVLQQLDAESVDAVVTDPPYGLGFMGQAWDRPGSAARGGKSNEELASSPYARARAEYAGASYGDRHASRRFGDWCEQWATEALRVLKPGGHLLAFGGTRTYHRLAAGIEDAGFELRDAITWLYGSGFPKSRNLVDAWEGWGTALKPASEPIVVARKALAGTVAENTARHGTGALNIDDCRIPSGEPDGRTRDRATEPSRDARYADGSNDFHLTPGPRSGDDRGRWPANVLLAHSPLVDDAGAIIGDACADGCVPGCAVRELDDQAGPLISGANPTRRGADKFRDTYNGFAGQTECDAPRGVDVGSASRFYPVFRYEAKAAQDERPRVGDIAHPTVKPLDLMRWLVRLVVPTGGTALDLFLGSGTTAEACVAEGVRCVGIEREADYIKLIKARLDKAVQIGLGI